MDEIKTASNKKRTQITAQKILKKYKNMKKPKRIYLVNDEDIETIDYGKLQEDLFVGKSIINAANKVTDFEQFKKELEERLQEYKNQLLNNTGTIDYVDNINLNDAREHKNLKIAAKKISDRYKKVRRKGKAATSVPTLHKISETFVTTHNKRKPALLPQKKYQKNIKLYGRI